jgi:hypothetical protein
MQRSWLPLRWRNQKHHWQRTDEKDVAKFKEGELADFRKTVKKIDTGYQIWSYINGYSAEDVLKFEEMVSGKC